MGAAQSINQPVQRRGRTDESSVSERTDNTRGQCRSGRPRTLHVGEHDTAMAPQVEEIREQEIVDMPTINICTHVVNLDSGRKERPVEYVCSSQSRARVVRSLAHHGCNDSKTRPLRACWIGAAGSLGLGQK